MASETFLRGFNEDAGQWVSERALGRKDGFDRFCSLSVMDGDTRAGAVIFHNFHPDYGLVELSAAGNKGWFTRAVMRKIFSTCFDDLRCQMAIAHTDEANRKSALLLGSLGFEGTWLARLGGRGKNMILWQLTEEAWRGSKLGRRA